MCLPQVDPKKPMRYYATKLHAGRDLRAKQKSNRSKPASTTVFYRLS
jgi:hypothetical protein